MDLYRDFHLVPQDEKHSLDGHSHGQEHQHIPSHDGSCDSCESQSPGHKRCHGGRLRRILVPVLVTLVALSALLAVSCYLDFDFFGLMDGEGLLKRATGDSSSESSFTKNKRAFLESFVSWFSSVR